MKILHLHDIPLLMHPFQYDDSDIRDESMVPEHPFSRVHAYRRRGKAEIQFLCDKDDDVFAGFTGDLGRADGVGKRVLSEWAVSQLFITNAEGLCAAYSFVSTKDVIDVASYDSTKTKVNAGDAMAMIEFPDVVTGLGLMIGDRRTKLVIGYDVCFFLPGEACKFISPHLPPISKDFQTALLSLMRESTERVPIGDTPEPERYVHISDPSKKIVQQWSQVISAYQVLGQFLCIYLSRMDQTGMWEELGPPPQFPVLSEQGKEVTEDPKFVIKLEDMVKYMEKLVAWNHKYGEVANRFNQEMWQKLPYRGRVSLHNRAPDEDEQKQIATLWGVPASE